MDDERSLPKYRRPGFLQRSLGLYLAARISGRLALRRGNDDGPVAPIGAVEPVDPAEPVSDYFNARDLNDI
jgi:hypothetical protein